MTESGVSVLQIALGQNNQAFGGESKYNLSAFHSDEGVEPWRHGEALFLHERNLRRVVQQRLGERTRSAPSVTGRLRSGGGGPGLCSQSRVD